MYHFVYEKYFEENKKNFSEKELIIFFKLDLSSKEEAKKNIKELQERLKYYPKNKKAIQITINSLYNNLGSLISSLYKEGYLIIGYGGTNKVNRFFLEQCQIDYLQDPHNTNFLSKVDFLHHFNSGLNQVLCTLAQEKEVGLFIETTKFSKKNWFRSKEFGRISQNIELARKYNLALLFAPVLKVANQERSELELQRIAQSLGTRVKESKIMFKNLQEKLERKEGKEILKGLKIE